MFVEQNPYSRNNMMIAGWIMFAILVCINTAVYVSIDMAFENDFWREDVN
jgi:hypothetical protein